LTKIDTNALQEKYDALQKRIQELQEQIQTESQAIVKTVFEEFFTNNPDVYGIGWTQYTPYWNDGESTHFHVHDLCLYLTQDSADDYGPYEGDQDILRYFEYKAKPKSRPSYISEQSVNQEVEEFLANNPGKDEEWLTNVISEFNKLVKVIGTIDDQYMEMIFGNHVKVLYTKDGFTVDEHSHD
jgi:hypothetical protein